MTRAILSGVSSGGGLVVDGTGRGRDCQPSSAAAWRQSQTPSTGSVTTSFLPLEEGARKRCLECVSVYDSTGGLEG